MNDTLKLKREKEKAVVTKMISIYCSKKHKHKNDLCAECTEINTYAHLRTDRCPFMESKTFCANCKVHCYKPDMREKIREIMRFSGPWMLLYAPIPAIQHVIESRKEKRRLANES